MPLRDRYRSDAVFARLVDMCRVGIREGRFTPGEVREAAVLAAYLEELEDPRPKWFHVVENELLRTEAVRHRASSTTPQDGEGR